MKNITIFLFVLFSYMLSHAYSQQLPGNSEEKILVNGSVHSRIVTQNEPEGNYYLPAPFFGLFDNNSTVRWTYTDPIAIGDRCETSLSGQLSVGGWGLNTQRVSLYNNSSSTPLWEAFTAGNTFINYTTISDDGQYIASGSYHNIFIFPMASSTPVFNFNLETALADTGVAGPLDITSDGGFIVASANRLDSSYILGFNRTSTNWVWRVRVGQINAGGASIQGIKMSRNDSLVIVNTYLGLYVFRTFTGELIYQGLINTNNSGTQFPQGISGNGNLIATINYSGQLKVYQWNGSTYNLLWQHTEPGAWMSAVDISYDGSLVACGTLNFLGGSNYDGKVKLFRTTNGSTPLWTYSGCGDEVNCVSFSGDARILAAASWGDIANLNNDLLVFKTSVPAATPIFAVNSPGSFFWCNASANGSTIVASGKRVHARTFGNGGEYYNIFIDTSDVPLSSGSGNGIPVSFNLFQNYPNPFNPVTKINFSLPEPGNVKLTVLDLLGREVSVLVNDKLAAGTYSADWDASIFSSGIYFYKMESGDFTEIRKMVLLK
jgi:hypothetical protein